MDGVSCGGARRDEEPETQPVESSPVRVDSSSSSSSSSEEDEARGSKRQLDRKEGSRKMIRVEVELEAVKENEVGVMLEYELPFGRLACSVGSVVDFSGDAIVNAANAACLGGGGVDGAVSRAGGVSLLRAREALPVVSGEDVRCRVGDAVATVAGDLAARWCIHAVGPNYDRLARRDDEEALRRGDAYLAAAYSNAMRRAKELEARTVAFSLLSAGIFRGSRSLRHVLRIGVNAVSKSSYPGLAKVHLVAFTRAERSDLLAAAAQVFGRRAIVPDPSPPVAGPPVQVPLSGE